MLSQISDVGGLLQPLPTAKLEQFNTLASPDGLMQELGLPCPLLRAHLQHSSGITYKWLKESLSLLSHRASPTVNKGPDLPREAQPLSK